MAIHTMNYRRHKAKEYRKSNGGKRDIHILFPGFTKRKPDGLARSQLRKMRGVTWRDKKNCRTGGKTSDRARGGGGGGGGNKKKNHSTNRRKQKNKHNATRKKKKAAKNKDSTLFNAQSENPNPRHTTREGHYREHQYKKGWESHIAQEI